jgi:hypothetical protein
MPSFCAASSSAPASPDGPLAPREPAPHGRQHLLLRRHAVHDCSAPVFWNRSQLPFICGLFTCALCAARRLTRGLAFEPTSALSMLRGIEIMRSLGLLITALAACLTAGASWAKTPRACRRCQSGCGSAVSECVDAAVTSCPTRLEGKPTSACSRRSADAGRRRPHFASPRASEPDRRDADSRRRRAWPTHRPARRFHSRRCQRAAPSPINSSTGSTHTWVVPDRETAV